MTLIILRIRTFTTAQYRHKNTDYTALQVPLYIQSLTIIFNGSSKQLKK